ncbi:MAG: hypothetical protein NWE93_07725 [Candidatus Bathyarchaeota archaeon]|nr:hypothetical protein [Candidatus Bathyarchaeota archaeon]
MAQPTSAQTSPTPSPSSTPTIPDPTFAPKPPKPSTSEFTLRYVDHSYDVPSSSSSSTDPYTGEVTTSTIPGYRVDQRTIEVTVKNDPSISYYNLRYKGHYSDQWSYFPFNPSDRVNGYSIHGTPADTPPYVASDSQYTTLTLYIPSNIPLEGLMDVQVQGLSGSIRIQHEGSLGAMMLGYNTTYNLYFEGTPSDWSDTKTIRIGSETSTATVDPTPYQSPQAEDDSANFSQPEPQPQLGITTQDAGLDLTEISLIIALGTIVALVAIIAYTRRKPAA